VQGTTWPVEIAVRRGYKGIPPICTEGLRIRSRALLSGIAKPPGGYIEFTEPKSIGRA
jgi:hypothetical protein